MAHQAANLLRSAVGNAIRVLAVVTGMIGACGCDANQESARPDGDVGHASAAVSQSGPAPSVSVPISGRDKPTCKRTDACRYEGRCAGEPGRCTAKSDDDCRSGQACRDWGTCKALEGVCVASSEEDCRASWVCRTKGFCSHRRDACVVRRDADCKRSDLCKFERKCQAHKGRCKK